MAGGWWVSGQTVHELADTWGLVVAPVKRDAAEASRATREALGDVDELRALVIGLANQARFRAAQETNHAKAGRVLIDAGKLIADITGCAAPKKLDVRNHEAGGDDDPWTVPEGKSDG
jgi:hypothetical protein